MASYTGQVATIHRQFNAEIKRAKSRQAVLNAYWKHKAQHERLLKQHLKEAMAQVNRTWVTAIFPSKQASTSVFGS